jgi:2-beta-glucuronyltransferase
MTFFNPLTTNFPILNLIFTPFLWIYGKIIPKKMGESLKNCDLIIFESTESLLLFDKVHKLNKNTKYIYRVSDLLEVNHTPQFVIDYEKKIAPMFDLISVPSEYIFKKFNHLPNARLHYHGINKELFATVNIIPEEYTQFEKNIVFVGTTHFDNEFIKIATGLFPQWGFHIIGPLNESAKAPNILYYGEMSFNKTIPYLKHADVGLQTRKSDYGLASLSDSLKVLQYTYCKLPIVAPNGLNSSRKNFIYYIPGDVNSIRIALNNAITFNRSEIGTSNIHSWDELVELLISEVFDKQKFDCVK